MKTTMLLVLAALAVGACGGGESKQAVASADSLKRDLQLAPVDTSKPINDQPTAVPAPAPEPAPAPRPAPVTPKPKPRPKPQPQPPAAAPAPGPDVAAAPAPAPTPAPAPLALAAGVPIPAVLNDSIGTKTNKVGDVVQARVAADVTDDQGRVIVPAGSTVTLKITALQKSLNKGDTTGTLTLDPQDVTVGGKTYPVVASISRVPTVVIGGTNAGDVAKVGAGTAIGAIVGRVIGGSTKGAVIGGVLGGAVGTQRAIETRHRDIVTPAGTKVTLTLRTPLQLQ